MRSSITSRFAPILVMVTLAAVHAPMAAASAQPAALTLQDAAALRSLSATYVDGWLKNDKVQVMSVMAPEAVFIPHDGVQPRTGRLAMEDFWFPGGKAVGTIPAYTQTISSISGDGGRAILYGRFDLSWDDSKQRYRWIGNFLIAARRQGDKWLVTHMMANDAEPVITKSPATS